MGMFCFQCQEAAKGTGCTVRGVCGKDATVSSLQDLLVYVVKGIAVYHTTATSRKLASDEVDDFITDSLFMTITNVNFSDEYLMKTIRTGLALRDSLKSQLVAAGWQIPDNLPDAATWLADSPADLRSKSVQVGILSTENEDVRSLRELLTYGLKGMAAYVHHARVLGYRDSISSAFTARALAATLDDSLSVDDLANLVLECGKHSVDVMALLDKANTSSYGNPEITSIDLGVRSNPGILVSGHDLKDLEELLKQTAGTGVDVYTHGEMLPAHCYPAFKQYDHFVGNYGNAWWQQTEEFTAFNGPVLMTTNCLVPPKASYRDRLYTTGVVGFPGVKHIPTRQDGGPKDFSALIEQAKLCPPPSELESGQLISGFAHHTVLGLADKVIEAVKSGAIKRFMVMAGCDGRMRSRAYYTEFATRLPQDTVILTAGCAKYRYNKLNLGDIGGIPRVLDAGQCNDSYSLVLIALALKDAFGLDDVNELPISYNIAWYEQKAVTVLLALLFLGVKNIHLGPTLPAFLSPNVATVLVDKFGIGGITNVADDMALMLGETSESAS